ncbi:hypothetical protein VNI00_012308 [Paramarasmius palmivorus]|uniref:N-acetyltransferase domain-containing protein n=1 Tax=Paramarasmius palmivorus TaxID=297713 RepID=A0AAW0C8R8_9AGAR
MAPHNTSLHSPTGRIRLEPPIPGNDAAIARLRMHPSTRKYLRSFPEYVSTEDARKLREAREQDPEVQAFHVYVRADGEVVKEAENEWEFAGSATVYHVNTQHRSCEIGLILSPDVRGRGIATDVLYTLLLYVFVQLRMHRVTFETAADNIPMRGWLENVAGARMEAMRAECRVDPGSDRGYSDLAGYAILEWEWHDQGMSGVKERLEKRLGLSSME